MARDLFPKNSRLDRSRLTITTPDLFIGRLKAIAVELDVDLSHALTALAAENMGLSLEDVGLAGIQPALDEAVHTVQQVERLRARERIARATLARN